MKYSDMIVPGGKDNQIAIQMIVDVIMKKDIQKQMNMMIK